MGAYNYEQKRTEPQNLLEGYRLGKLILKDKHIRNKQHYEITQLTIESK